MLFMIALFNMSELTKNRGRIGVQIANVNDVATRKIDEVLKCQRILGPKALSCKNLRVCVRLRRRSTCLCVCEIVV